MRKYHDLVLPMKSKEKNPGAENYVLQNKLMKGARNIEKVIEKEITRNNRSKVNHIYALKVHYKFK